MDILVKIKRLVLSGNVLFTRKAEFEIEQDQLSQDMVLEAILNAPGIKKKIRSSNPFSGRREYLYIRGNCKTHCGGFENLSPRANFVKFD
jgi:hypothetical protein